jgi:hypothetical protein
MAAQKAANFLAVVAVVNIEVDHAVARWSFADGTDAALPFEDRLVFLQADPILLFEGASPMSAKCFLRILLLPLPRLPEIFGFVRLVMSTSLRLGSLAVLLVPFFCSSAISLRVVLHP